MHNFMCGIFPQLVVACRQLLASYNRRDIQENVVNKKQVGSQWLGSYTRQIGRCGSTNFLIYSKIVLRMLKLIRIHPCSVASQLQEILSPLSLSIYCMHALCSHTQSSHKEKEITQFQLGIQRPQQFLVVSPPLCVDNRFWIIITIIINIYSGWPRKSQRPIVSGLFPLGRLGKQNKSKKPSLVLELSHYPKYSVRNIYNLSD